MIDWIHELGKEWGAYLRTLGNPYGSQNILDVMANGASSRAYQSYPLNDIDEDQSEPEVLSFHRAFMRLKEVNRDVVYVLYVPRFAQAEKIAALKQMHNLSKSKIYEIRNQSHCQIWGYIDAHLQMHGKSFPEKVVSGLNT